jgi:signal transduction histidine kinase
VDEFEQSELLDVAARARINERCAMAYLHDVRGTMQALFSAIELLGRSARAGNGDAARIDKACGLAKRAIATHEKSVLDILQALTLQSAEATPVDLAGMVTKAVQFLRNEAAMKSVTISLVGEDGDSTPGLTVMAEQARFQTLLVGLVAAAIDATPAGEKLPIAVRRVDGWAQVTIGSDAGYRAHEGAAGPKPQGGRLRPSELTRLFAERYLATGGGRLDIDAGTHPHGTLKLFYPLAP